MTSLSFSPQEDAGAEAAPRPGHIRSFVMRRGHLSDGQRTAHAQFSALYTVPFERHPLNPEQVFARPAPLILEIGFGMGHTTAAIAAQRPNENFLGIEVYPPGVGSLLRQIHEQQLSNLRIIQHDAVEVLREMITPNSLAGVHIYFPDPWPKKRHHKRRLIQPPFVSVLTERLSLGAYLHCATDWQDYAEQMLAVLGAEPRLRNSSQGYAPKPSWRPETKFERRGLRLGHGVWDLVFTRCTEPQEPRP